MNHAKAGQRYILDLLNPSQREAVLANDGHVLVLAGAGSGKTRVLTTRVAYLIREKGISPERILAFTFTNKAAGEMKARVETLLGRRNLPVWIGTFHATGLRILRREAKHIGFNNNFAVFDEDDSLSLVRKIIKDRGWPLDEHPVPLFRNRISRWKNALVPPEEALGDAGDMLEKRAAEAYGSYIGELRRCNAFDFDDLITRVVELFTAHPKVKERYARQFLYVLVDEFQDTNAIQMVMIDALASRHGNLFVVGDDDQAIYGWRGATVENILTFDRVYKDTILIRLEENYRSTNGILKAANELISYNTGRKGKNLWSRKGQGESVRLALVGDEIEEAEAVREFIIELLRAGFSKTDIAVLYRTNAQSRAIENAMRRGGLPYQIIGGVRFYERKEIKDLLGYIKLINNPNDDVNFRRVVNVPRRGIGAATIERLGEASGEKSILPAVWEKDILSGMRKQQREGVEKFSELIASLRLKAGNADAHEVLCEVIERTGYREHLMQDPVTSQTRLENMEELLVETQRHVASAEDKTLSGFLEGIALLSDIDTLKSDESVALMTLHNSKGLEYRAVLITGLEEGLLPHYSSIDSPEELEEERRLFYVGITRAGELLFLFSAANRMRYGSRSGNRPSRFLEELPRNLVEIAGGSVAAAAGGGLLKDAFDPDAEDGVTGIAMEKRLFRKGIQVEHPTYGEGTIRRIEGSGAETRVTVYFPGKGEKKFLARFAPFRFSR